MPGTLSYICKSIGLVTCLYISNPIIQFQAQMLFFDFSLAFKAIFMAKSFAMLTNLDMIFRKWDLV